jgi:hypothetical protein
MNAEQQEAFTERAAIMEIDGGLDRRVATLRAFELYFPEDYRECMRISAQYPDGETALYEFLKGLLIKPKDARESPLLNEYSPGRENPHTAVPKGPSYNPGNTTYTPETSRLGIHDRPGNTSDRGSMKMEQP